LRLQEYKNRADLRRHSQGSLELIAKNTILTAANLVLAGFVLCGCSTDQKKGFCPSANILANTATVSVFRDKMDGDPAGVLYTVQVTGVKTDCSFDKDEGTADSNLIVSFRASRTPTGESGAYAVPFYVATIRDSSAIISKQVLSAPFSFQAGESSTTFTADVPSYIVRYDNGKKPYDYGLLTGIQLTQAQLDYNKKMGRFAP
jgi:hypothetical protein